MFTPIQYSRQNYNVLTHLLFQSFLSTLPFPHRLEINEYRPLSVCKRDTLRGVTWQLTADNLAYINAPADSNSSCILERIIQCRNMQLFATSWRWLFWVATLCCCLAGAYQSFVKNLPLSSWFRPADGPSLSLLPRWPFVVQKVSLIA